MTSSLYVCLIVCKFYYVIQQINLWFAVDPTNPQNYRCFKALVNNLRFSHLQSKGLAARIIFDKPSIASRNHLFNARNNNVCVYDILIKKSGNKGCKWCIARQNHRSCLCPECFDNFAKDTQSDKLYHMDTGNQRFLLLHIRLKHREVFEKTDIEIQEYLKFNPTHFCSLANMNSDHIQRNYSRYNGCKNKRRTLDESKNINNLLYSDDNSEIIIVPDGMLNSKNFNNSNAYIPNKMFI